MLTSKLLASKYSNIVYVGANTQSVSRASNITVTITNLTGGVASAPAGGDLVVAYIGTGGETVDLNLAITGYTEVADLYANSASRDTNFGVYYKFMPATPDTTFTIAGGFNGSTGSSGIVYISVWRNVDTVNTLDVTSTTSSATNSVLADPPSITPVTSGAVIVSGGFGAEDRGGAPTYSSSDLTDFRSLSDSRGVIGVGYKKWTGGAFDPAAFTFSTSDSTNYSYAAATLALRS